MEFIQTVAPYVLAVLGTSTAATLITLWVLRKNREAERLKMKAETSKATAETDRLEGENRSRPVVEQRSMVEALGTVSDNIVGMMERLEKAARDKETLITMNGELERAVKACESREALLQAAIKDLSRSKAALGVEVDVIRARLDDLETRILNEHTPPQ